MFEQSKTLKIWREISSLLDVGNSEYMFFTEGAPMKVLKLTSPVDKKYICDHNELAPPEHTSFHFSQSIRTDHYVCDL